ncbi:SLC13 family permease [Allorhodopirellula solitaria]|uniref:Sodium-dependent dicarboxylate transporter SdcS n=1 Tax=Allorhodopirellula solitaria TaxID=2527987 RepID=A0A5C5XQA9_9BACT|nr:SLC13 family permease [Allorhodopirellula solitaria]TWT64828.1 Sodium-dependent dicarboxylate transporter SdcS [Allorhodopirellula solitaria]
MNAAISRWMLLGGPTLAVVISLACYVGGLPPQASACAGVAVLCATWWIFESLSLAVVGLVPFVLLPLLGVVGHKEIASSYGHTVILLLLGGFLLSAAMERSGAHRRIAIAMVRLVGGTSGKRLVLGFMLATAVLSMWISNSATALMMLPIAMAVLQQSGDSRLRTPLLLGIAYSASVGGMATPIGTPPNVVFMGQFFERTGHEMPFATWMSIGLPITLVMLPIIWWWLTRGVASMQPIEMPSIGPMQSNERRVLMIFFITALLWIFRAGPGGGWSALLPVDSAMVGDSTVALGASLMMFLCPSGRRSGEHAESLPAGGATGRPSGSVAGQSNGVDGKCERLLDWETAAKIPWGILVMFGGGMALARGFQDSGLSTAIGHQLTFMEGAPTWLIVLAVCCLVTFMTEITSSTATAMLLLPILGELAVQLGLPPAMLMVPGTISCSCAFMLPVATPPNAIVFGAGGISTEEMARTGLVLNLIAAAVITGLSLMLMS